MNGGMGSIPGLGTKIPHAMQLSQKIGKKKKSNGMKNNFVLEIFWKERFFQCSSQETNFSSSCQKRRMAVIFFFLQ